MIFLFHLRKETGGVPCRLFFGDSCTEKWVVLRLAALVCVVLTAGNRVCRNVD